MEKDEGGSSGSTATAQNPLMGPNTGTNHRPLRILQANLRKMPETQLSLLNDISLKHYHLLLISEPATMIIEGKLTIHTHHKWTPIIPTAEEEIKKPGMCKSMIWVNRDHPTVQQVEVKSPDITAVITQLHNRKILVISVYVPHKADGNHLETLESRINLINAVVSTQRKLHGSHLDILIAGDFNRHHHLWGGNHVFARHNRGDEAAPIIDLMADHSLQSLLPRGTITFESPQGRSTIDLTLASPGLAAQLIQCRIHPQEHGSDHRAIQSTFDINISTPLPSQARLQLKQAPWEEVRARLTHLQSRTRPIRNKEELDQTVERLLSEVSRALAQTCPTIQPSPYCKRWWTPELTQLRNEYTRTRNLCTRMREYGDKRPDLEDEARKRRQKYHTAIRDRKRQHWKEFLQNVNNIWTATRYMVGKCGTAVIPTLQSGDEVVEDDKAKAELLLSTFFPPTPTIPEQTLTEPGRHEPLPFYTITRAEVKAAIMKTNPWKAPGQDDLPAAVRQNTRPVTGDVIVQIFEASIQLGYVPRTWKSARIVVLRKPGKSPSLPKAYRLISLLSTLGKALESVIAARISYLTEKHHLLPENHFGARGGRSCEQALNILVEKIYNAWRDGKVLSLVSFDVKGAYNGVAKEVLLKKLREFRIPDLLIRWVASFCSQRRASLVVNSFCSEEMDITYAGLPQGSPLSPILFLFMNADLVRVDITNCGGAIAFVDDYTHWVIGPNADENTAQLQQHVIPRALKWATDSGATFEADKTSFIHFTRKPLANPSPPLPLWVGETAVVPQSTVKILGVVMDQELRFRFHVAEAAKKGIRAVLALKRLRGIRPSSARQLFTAMVTSTVDYAASVWCTPRKDSMIPNWVVKAFRPVQRYATQAITGAFRSTALVIAESEANIESTETRLRKRILRHWIRCHTLPLTHPFWDCQRQTSFQTTTYCSPFKYFRDICCPRPEMEIIQPFALSPRHPTLQKFIDLSGEPLDVDRIQRSKRAWLKISISCAVQDGNLRISLSAQVDQTTTFQWSRTVGTEDDTNVYYTHLGGIWEATTYITTAMTKIRMHPARIWATIFTNNRSTLQALAAPARQSGQRLISQITQRITDIHNTGMWVDLKWTSSQDQTPGIQAAKALARRASRTESETRNPEDMPLWAKVQLQSTVWRTTRKEIVKQGVDEFQKSRWGWFTRSIDKALPGKHTKKLYDNLTREEASILTQLRTGHASLNGFLFSINRTDNAICQCGENDESVQHFLFQCKQWDHLREDMTRIMATRPNDLSLALGGYSPQLDQNGKPLDGERNAWSPNTDVVQTIIIYAIKTGRFSEGQITP
jgi:hypothetical protein